MDGFGSLGPRPIDSGENFPGGILDAMRRMGRWQSAPAVPADGAMQPTIGPGASPAMPPAPVKMGLPPGGILGLLQGQSPQGLAGLLQRGLLGMGGGPVASPLSAGAGMLSGLPGTPGSPLAGPAPQLPMDINPMNQF